MTTAVKLLGPDDEPQESGAIVAVNYGDYRRQEGERPRAVGRRGVRSDRAEHRFREFIHTAGGSILEESWLGAMYKHRVRCRAGHECEVTPNSVAAKGRRGFCRVCAGQDSATAERAFRARVAALGGTVLEPTWLGSIRPHRVRCAAGHESSPTPGNVARGQGICPTCAGHHSETTKMAFYERVHALGGEVIEPTWLGVDHPHRVRCALGHIVTPRPFGVARGVGICRLCAGQDSEAAWARFRSQVADLGGVVLEPQWLGANQQHRVRCAMGHEVSPRPDHVSRGIGVCRRCAGRSWDVFYVVVDRVESRLKFGITSGDPRPRLTDHAHDGYGETLLCLRSLPDGAALAIERAVRSALTQAGERPVRGREYFDISVQGLVFDVVAGRRDLWQSMESVAEDDPQEVPV